MFSLMIVNKAYGCHRPLAVNRELLMERALTHDLPEVLTGDLSTPIKKKLRAAGAGAILQQIEDEVDPRVTYLRKKTADSVEGDIVKLADMIEAISFMNGCGKGNHSRMVEEVLKRDMGSLIIKMNRDWPQGRWRRAADAILSDLTSGVDSMLMYEADSRKGEGSVEGGGGAGSPNSPIIHYEEVSGFAPAVSEGGECD